MTKLFSKGACDYSETRDDSDGVGARRLFGGEFGSGLLREGPVAVVVMARDRRLRRCARRSMSIVMAKAEVPANVWNRLKVADSNNDNLVTQAEFVVAGGNP